MFRDCSDLPPGSDSGEYTLTLLPSGEPVAAYCDMEDGDAGWTVIQRRSAHLPPEDFRASEA